MANFFLFIINCDLVKKNANNPWDFGHIYRLQFVVVACPL